MESGPERAGCCQNLIPHSQDAPRCTAPELPRTPLPDIGSPKVLYPAPASCVISPVFVRDPPIVTMHSSSWMSAFMFAWCIRYVIRATAHSTDLRSPRGRYAIAYRRAQRPSSNDRRIVGHSRLTGGAFAVRSSRRQPRPAMRPAARTVVLGVTSEWCRGRRTLVLQSSIEVSARFGACRGARG